MIASLLLLGLTVNFYPSLDACFIFAMILFGLLYFFTIRQIYQKEGREVLGIITIIGTVVQVLSYIAVAISNPGVITQADFENEPTEQSGNIKR